MNFKSCDYYINDNWMSEPSACAFDQHQSSKMPYMLSKTSIISNKWGPGWGLTG